LAPANLRKKRRPLDAPADLTDEQKAPETYRFHSSHTLRRSQRKINDLPAFSRLFPAQTCPRELPTMSN
jgi:hypothetical protein